MKARQPRPISALPRQLRFTLALAAVPGPGRAQGPPGTPARRGGLATGLSGRAAPEDTVHLIANRLNGETFRLPCRTLRLIPPSDVTVHAPPPGPAAAARTRPRSPTRSPRDASVGLGTSPRMSSLSTVRPARRARPGQGRNHDVAFTPRP
jgi:hypothetical protein